MDATSTACEEKNRLADRRRGAAPGLNCMFSAVAVIIELQLPKTTSETPAPHSFAA